MQHLRYGRPSRAGQIGRWLAAVGLIAVTPVLLFVAVRSHRAAAATAGWPTTSGIVTRAEVREVTKSRYATEVTYIYQVDGRDYVGTRIRAADPHHRLPAARAEIEGLAVGQAREVFYNPADPAEALLVPGASGEAWLLILPAASFAGGTAILAWLLATRRRRRVWLEQYV